MATGLGTYLGRSLRRPINVSDPLLFGLKVASNSAVCFHRVGGSPGTAGARQRSA